MRYLVGFVVFVLGGVASAGTLTPTPASVDFGVVSVSAPAASDSLVLANAGSSTTITGFTLTGAGCSEFSVSAALPAPLGSGGSLTVNVFYNPSDRNADTCTVTVVDDNAVADTFQLLGDGAAPVLSVSPPTLTFANQLWATGTGETLLVTITNNGEESIATSNLTASLTTGTQFALGTSSGFPIAGGGGTGTIAVVFNPTSAGAKTDTLTLSLDNDPPAAGNGTVALSGTGTQGEVAVAPLTIAFGTVSVGTEASDTFTISNSAANGATAALDYAVSEAITDVTISCVPDASCMGTLAVDATATITVAFLPTSLGNRTGNIVVTTSDPNEATTNVAMSGAGGGGVLTLTASPISITTNTIDFGPVRLGAMASTTITVTNSGTANATLAAVALGSVSQGFAVSGFTANTVVAANGGTATFSVTFMPGMDSHGTTTLTVDSEWNDPSVTLVGDGQPFGITVTPTAVAIGNVDWDSFATRTITVTSAGPAAFDLTNVALEGADAGEFDMLTFTAGSLAAGQSQSISVRAHPTDAMLGARSASLVITTDLPSGEGQTTTIPLSYTSIGPAVTIEPGLTIDFGAVALGGGDTVDVTISNSGDAAMVITAVSELTGSFSATALASMTIAPASSQTLSITFAPTTAGSEAEPEMQTLTFTTTGLFSSGVAQPPSFAVTLRGYGASNDMPMPDDAASGCCSAGGAEDAACGLVLVLACVRRRRRNARP